ncbi:MAG TPA: helix-turn-helix transcriptional regulator [Chitinophaga sp.]
MLDQTRLLDSLKQHNSLNIRVITNCNVKVPEEIYRQLLTPHRSLHYVFLLVGKGHAEHAIDMQPVTVNEGQLLFVLPHQIHLISQQVRPLHYAVLHFDQHCLSLLPKPFLFLLNPLGNQLLAFEDKTLQRVKTLFGLLIQLLQEPDANPELVLSNLNTLLTEFNHTYLANNKRTNDPDGQLSKFIGFKLMVEEQFMEQPAVQTIAGSLSLSTNSLYNIVKHYSGVSPKEFITKRLMVEAQRRLYYSETSIKELAYELGFTDPGYFSRLFKKSTGKSTTEFMKAVQDLSHH